MVWWLLISCSEVIDFISGVVELLCLFGISDFGNWMLIGCGLSGVVVVMIGGVRFWWVLN